VRCSIWNQKEIDVVEPHREKIVKRVTVVAETVRTYLKSIKVFSRARGRQPAITAGQMEKRVLLAHEMRKMIEEGKWDKFVVVDETKITVGRMLAMTDIMRWMGRS